MNTVRYYPTDLTEAQWRLLASLLPDRKWRPGGPGRPPCDVRLVLNGLLDLTKTGCQWRMIPKEFGHWNTRYGYFKQWRRTGVWAHLMEQLRRMERIRQGRKPAPSAGRIDSQSIKSATQGRSEGGSDGNKKIKGRKRHLLGDTRGLVLTVVVTAAHTEDRRGLGALLQRYFATGSQRLARCGWMGPIGPRGWRSGCAA
jgi:putative transposase